MLAQRDVFLVVKKLRTGSQFLTFRTVFIPSAYPGLVTLRFPRGRASASARSMLAAFFRPDGPLKNASARKRSVLIFHQPN